jgi:hypothetical protein
MKTLDLNTLAQVTGGLSSTAAITQQLTTLNQTLANNQNNQNNNLFSSPLGAIALVSLLNKNRGSVISGPSGTIVA